MSEMVPRGAKGERNYPLMCEIFLAPPTHILMLEIGAAGVWATRILRLSALRSNVTAQGRVARLFTRTVHARSSGCRD
jgi:hypothetical protein